MKALPVRFQKQEHTFEDVRYTIQPLTNQLRAHIQTENLERIGTDDRGFPILGTNKGGIIYDVIGFSLIELSGLEGLEVEYEDVNIGKNIYTRVKDYCLDLFPMTLFDDIKIKATTASIITEEETEEMGFTPDSSTETSPAPETSGTVAAEPELKSDLPLPTTDVETQPLSGDASGSE